VVDQPGLALVVGARDMERKEARDPAVQTTLGCQLSEQFGGGGESSTNAPLQSYPCSSHTQLYTSALERKHEFRVSKGPCRAFDQPFLRSPAP
jgi:hypothetical protein